MHVGTIPEIRATLYYINDGPCAKLKTSHRVGLLWPVGIFAVTKNTHNNIIRSKYNIRVGCVCVLYFCVHHH